MTIPPTYAHIAPAGTPAIVVMAKMVLMVGTNRMGDDGVFHFLLDYNIIRPSAHW